MNQNKNKKYLGLSALLALSLVGTACGKKSDKDDGNANSAQLQELKKQNKQLQDEVKKLKGQIDSERSGNGASNAQLRMMLERISKLNSEKIDEIVQTMDSFKLISDKLDESLKNEKANATSLSETIQLVNEARDKIVDINQLKEELAKLNVGEEVMAEVRGVIAAAAAKLQQIDDRVTTLEGSLKEMGVKLEAEAKKLSEANAALEEKLKAVSEAKEKDAKKMEALQQTVLGLTSNVGILQQTLIDLEKKIEEQSTSNNEAMNLIKADLSDLKNNQVPGILQRLAKLEATGGAEGDANLVADLKALQGSVNDLSKRLQGL